MHQATRERTPHIRARPPAACGSSAALATPCARLRSEAASATSPNKGPNAQNDQRQFCHCANGTASRRRHHRRHRIVAALPTTKPTRVGRLRFARAPAADALPIAIAAPITIVPANNSTAEGSTERNIMPATSNTIEPTSTFSSTEKRRASRAANGENSANASMGKAADQPDKRARHA